MKTRRVLQGQAKRDDEDLAGHTAANKKKQIPPQQTVPEKRRTKRPAADNVPGVPSKKTSTANASEASAAKASTAKGSAAKKPDAKGPLVRVVPDDDASVSSSKSDDCESDEDPGLDAAVRILLRNDQKRIAENLRKDKASGLSTSQLYPIPPTLFQASASAFSIKVGDEFDSKIHLQSATQTWHELIKRRFKVKKSRETTYEQRCLTDPSCAFHLNGRYVTNSGRKPGRK